MVNDRKTPYPPSPTGGNPRRQHRKRDGEREADQRYGAVAEKIRPRTCRGLKGELATIAYLSEVLIEVNLLNRLVPRPFTMVMIASEMPAAIRPYSIAVAPDSSFTKCAIRFFITQTPCVHVASRQG